ncbi:MAG TPA: bifunctional lysylphosphatidylglycerol flippase/synthetase MprF [Roseiarcus sp.]|nr:bifunctional lysylphosphatidylglycerol flippase/synthetase MprF [Roseiarcus sp.]
MRRLLLSLAIAFGLVAFVIAFGGVARDLDYAATMRTLCRLPASALALSVLMTAISFAGLIGREATALRYVGARPPRLALLVGGLASAALGNVAGFGVLTAAAVRYRIYGAVGIDALAVARIVGFVVAGYAIGLAAVGGGAAVLRAPEVAAMFGWSPMLVGGLGLVALGVVAALLAFDAPPALRRLRRLGLPDGAPGRGLIALQVLCAGVRLIGAAAALWALLPPGQIGLLSFVPLFVAATALGSLSHVPAGAGVFEFVLLWALRGHASGEAVAAALIAYRAIYYVLPLALSAAVLAAFEWRVAFDPKMPRADAKLARAAARLTPTFVGAVAFTIGVILIFSGATPTFGKRLSLLARHTPLWAVETASLLGSMLGVAYLFLARGLIGRRDGAWRLAAAATLASLAFALLKGLAFGEAALLVCFLALLMATRPLFDRPTSLIDQPFTYGWFAAIGAILAAAFGILWLAFHNAPARSDDLLAFAFHAQAPRALRAVLGACVSAAGLATWQLLRAPSGRPRTPGPATLERALEVIEAQPRSEAKMALMGDKALLFSASGRAFLMYGKHGRSWIALYDPIGPREEWRELVERFLRLAAEHGGRANIYQARPQSLSFYLDLGFTAAKLGEEAVIDLAAFTLKGGGFHHLRYALKRGERDGLTFEWLATAQTRLDDLALISAEWLERRRGEEKGFSVAAFDAGFLAHQRVALLSERGRPVAFASVMTAGAEGTLGLLRATDAQSPAAMEFLICRLAMALRDEGLARFSLGAAPLAGVGGALLPSRWSRLAAFLWRHGDRFYNFQGLRAFKNKFNPEWEPRYFVSSGALGPYVALADAVALIGSSSAKSGVS